MRLELKHPYLSIKEMSEIDLPNFAVLIGRNGVGKTQLLDAIKSGRIVVSGVPTSEIEKYDINTFTTNDSHKISWGHCIFGDRTAELYFSEKSGPSLAETAKNIFSSTLRTFQIEEDSDRCCQFKEQLRSHVRKTPDFNCFPAVRANGPLSQYSKEIVDQVIRPLTPRQSSGNRESGTCNNDPAILLSLAMKLSGKLPHELRRDDLLNAVNYEGKTIENQLSRVFARYKIEQFIWAHTQSETRQASIKELMSEYRQKTHPPWTLLREKLDRMRDASNDPELFNFEFSNPDTDKILFTEHLQYSFTSKFTNRATGESYSLKNLSSGEKILMSLCMASFNKTLGRRQPRLVLLDELDAVLHPAMISALITGLKELFVNNGMGVMMATHSVTTVSLLEEREIFRVARCGGKVNVQPVLKSEAVTELSEGLATIDTGLRIVASEGVAPITILTEGKNTLHLKKWVSLFFPEKVAVFNELPNRTGKDQLITYGQLLAKVKANTHFLIVWDCDAKGSARKLSDELTGSSNVTTFSFERRENRIAAKGIENKYEERFLEPYSNIILDGETKKETGRCFDGNKKTDFAEHVYSKGTHDYFAHFDDLMMAVQDILKTLQCVQ